MNEMIIILDNPLKKQLLRAKLKKMHENQFELLEAIKID